MRTILWGVAALALAGGLGGCQTTAVEGKVVEGRQGVMPVVDATDPRLKSPGVEGAVLELRGRAGEHLIASATSGADGSFKIPVKESVAASEELTLTATRAGYLPAKGRVAATGEEKRVLVVMRRNGNRE